MPLLCGCKRHEGMDGRVNRSALKLCKSSSVYHKSEIGKSSAGEDVHYSHYHEARFTEGAGLGFLNCWIWNFTYIPKKKDDKVGFTRSPQAELFGFWRRRGPVSPMIRAPTGAVRRMDRTATVSTSMPYFCSCLSSFVLAMSKAVEPIAAWWRQGHTRVSRLFSLRNDIYQKHLHTLKKNNTLTYLHCGFGHPR